MSVHVGREALGRGGPGSTFVSDWLLLFKLSNGLGSKRICRAGYISMRLACSAKACRRGFGAGSTRKTEALCQGRSRCSMIGRYRLRRPAEAGLGIFGNVAATVSGSPAGILEAERCDAETRARCRARKKEREATVGGPRPSWEIGVCICLSN